MTGKACTDGNVYIINSNQDGALSVTSTPPEAYAELEGLNINYGTVASLGDLGVTIAKGHVPANALVPPHAGDSHYALFVLSGSGELTLNLEDGTETSRMAFRPGDLIVFPPHAQHGWINQGEDMEWLGVDIAPR